MQSSFEYSQECISRLKKIEGQVRGLQSMVVESRSCSDVIMQISSVRAAIHQLSIRILEAYLTNELVAADEQSDQDIKELMSILSRSFK